LRCQPDGILVPLEDVDNVMRLERQLNAAPELIVLGECIWIIVQNAEVPAWHAFPNQHPHPFDGNRLLRIVDTDPKNQLRQIARL
jgi:hypothetical protein